MIAATKNWDGNQSEVVFDVEGVAVEGTLVVPTDAQGVVLFAHGSGSSRYSPRNRYVAQLLHSQGIGTLLFDLLTRQEELADQRSGELRFDIPFLARRLVGATRWIADNPSTRDLKVRYFGASFPFAPAEPPTDTTIVGIVDSVHVKSAPAVRTGRA